MTTIINADCLQALREMPDNSIDAICTDPPYGLSNTTPDHIVETLTAWVGGDREYTPNISGGFMGSSWDAFVPPPAVWDECLRVLKPGGHMAVFAGTRTLGIMDMSVRLAGFDHRDTVGFGLAAWVHGQGFPKSQNVAKKTGNPDHEGLGTSLKPSWEPILLYRKPFKGTVADAVTTWGTGALNIAATRIGPQQTGGRFPANVALDRETAGLLDQQSGNRPGFKSQTDRTSTPSNYFGADKHPGEREGYNDEGGASRFFHVADNLDDLDAPFRYCAKAPKKERPSYTDEDGNTVQHATVKPLSLMRWLVKLITPPGGTVLDPFAGSGTTVEAAILEGFNPVGVEAHAPYIPLIHQRVQRAEQGQAALNIA